MKILKNRTVLGVLCIVFSLCICFGVVPMFHNASSEKVDVVRVITDIEAGDQITEDMIEVVEVGGYNLSASVIREKATAVGTYALADLYQGDYILGTKISETMQEENAYLHHLNGEQQAISVTIKNFANGLSGKLQSGDIVSIISPDHNGLGSAIIPSELKYVEVISVTAESGMDVASDAQYEEEEAELPATVTLLVNEAQAKLLAQLEVNGDIHVSLVYRGTAENGEKFLKVQQEVFETEEKEIAEEEDVDEEE